MSSSSKEVCEFCSKSFLTKNLAKHKTVCPKNKQSVKQKEECPNCHKSYVSLSRHKCSVSSLKSDTEEDEIKGAIVIDSKVKEVKSSKVDLTKLVDFKVIELSDSERQVIWNLKAEKKCKNCNKSKLDLISFIYISYKIAGIPEYSLVCLGCSAEPEPEPEIKVSVSSKHDIPFLKKNPSLMLKLTNFKGNRVLTEIESKRLLSSIIKDEMNMTAWHTVYLDKSLVDVTFSETEGKIEVRSFH